MARKYRRREKQISLPDVPLKAISWLYYVHNGQPYPVSGSPTSIFKSALSVCHPGAFKDSSTNKLLEQEELGNIDRWFLLNELNAMHNPMKLYTSRFEAEKFLKKSLV